MPETSDVNPVPQTRLRRLRMLCGMQVVSEPELCNPAEYHQHTLYFCNEFCLQAFRADPETFYKTHKGSYYSGQRGSR